MKRSALILATFGLVAQPALARGVESRLHLSEQSPRGAFAGAKFTISLGVKEKRIQAGLAVASTQRNAAGGTLNFSNGLELGFAGDEKVRLSVGGKPLSTLNSVASDPERAPRESRAGISTIGWIGIGAGVALVAGALLFNNALNSCEDHDDEC